MYFANFQDTILSFVFNIVNATLVFAVSTFCAFRFNIRPSYLVHLFLSYNPLSKALFFSLLQETKERGARSRRRRRVLLHRNRSASCH